jgi:alkylation response protein AidB-like acyl-CoA dehydrogenase
LVPERYGGGTISAAGLMDLSLIAEQFGRHLAPGPLVPTNVVAAAIADFGTEEQCRDLLPGIVAGDALAAWCLSEPGSRRQWWDVDLAATPTHDGYVINGTKSWVEGAPDADYFLVAARAPEGLTQFLIPSSTPGITLEPLDGLDLVRHFAEVAFCDTEIPRSALVGEAGSASVALERQLQLALVLQCTETTGCMATVFDFTLEWTFDRFTFGRPLASYQEIKHRCADQKLWLEASLATVEGAMHAVQGNHVDARELVSVAKAYVGKHAVEMVQDCVQMHGGIGVTWEHDIHLYLRRITQNWALFGTPREHLDRIALFLADASGP